MPYLGLAPIRSVVASTKGLKCSIQLIQIDVNTAQEVIDKLPEPTLKSPDTVEAFLDDVKWMVRDVIGLATVLRGKKSIAERILRKAQNQLAEAGKKSRAARRVCTAARDLKNLAEETIKLHQELLDALGGYCDASFTKMEKANIESKDDVDWIERRDRLDGMISQALADAHL